MVLAVLSDTFEMALFSLVVFSFFSIVSGKTVYKRRRRKYEFLSQETDFSNSLIQLIASVIKIDKKQTDSELRFVEKALNNHFKPGRVQRLMSQIRTNLSKDEINVAGICRLIRSNFDAASKVQLMHLLIGICAADGILSKKEDQLLRSIAVEIRMPFTTYKSLLNMFRFKNEGQKQQQKKFTSSIYRYKQALGILELTEDASDSEVKKAYRKLAVLHHPDKVVHLGEEMQNAANDKFLIISEAYEYVKRHKGFS